MGKLQTSLLFLLATTAAFASLAFADGRVDLDTANDVIERLEATLPALKDQPSEAKVLARVADLHSDRARQLEIQASQSSDKKPSAAASADRKTAIQEYERALALTKNTDEILTTDQKSTILTQTAYLYSAEGQNEKAKNVFTQIINGKQSSEIKLIGEAYFGRGELFFREGDYVKAQKDYNQALRHPLKNEALAEYRLAWCEFNAGHAHAAKALLVSILEVPASEDVPTSFRRDMARDLSTFIARDKVNQTTIDELLKLTPEPDRAANLFYLGQEADRLGNKKGALLVWKYYSNTHTVASAEDLEIQIRTAQTLWDQNQNSDALELYKNFLVRFQIQKCASYDNCDELKARSRAFVHNWITREKNKPTANLLVALEAYSKANTDDPEMLQWTGHIARKLKKFDKATAYYHVSADAAQSTISSTDKNDTSKINQFNRILEGSLLAEIECAEELNNNTLKASAYQHYLTLQPNGAKQADVRYQIAEVKFQNKDFSNAASEFHAIAVNKSANETIRLQAAHLSLDALTNLGQGDQVEVWAKEYGANEFPKHQNDFYAIARKASVTSAIVMAQTQTKSSTTKNASVESMTLALQKLKLTPLNGATDEEKINIFKNEIILAEKLNDVPTVQVASRNLLAVHALSAKDREFALNHQLWAAEVEMDFNTAFKVAKQMHSTKLSKDEHVLQMAILAELSGHEAQGYYREFLNSSHNIERANVIRAKMVRESRRPWQTLSQYKSALRRTPEIFGSVVLECFAKDRNSKQLRSYISDRAIRRSSQYADLSRYLDLEANRELDQRLRHSRLNTRSDQQLARTLVERLKLLRQAEKVANLAERKNDFILEIVDLHRLSHEYSRLTDELTDIPMPKKLKPAQRKEYKRLMQNKIDPYKRLVKQIDARIENLWANSNAVNSLVNLSRSDLGAARKLLVSDLNLILPLAPHSQKNQIINAISYAEANPNHVELARARDNVRQNPFDTNRIGELKRLEARRGDTSMVVFLDARLADTTKSTSKKGAL